MSAKWIMTGGSRECLCLCNNACMHPAGYGGGGHGQEPYYGYHGGSYGQSRGEQQGALAQAAALKREQEADVAVAERFAQIVGMVQDCQLTTAAGIQALPLDLCAVLRAGDALLPSIQPTHTLPSLGNTLLQTGEADLVHASCADQGGRLWHVKIRTGQDRTGQDRTEQNRTEQNRTEQN